MLHTAVTHTDKNIRDALDKSVEKLESAGRAAHDETTKEVVDELGRMRANFRDVYNKLNSNGEALNAAVHDVVAQLRAELREVRVVLADLTPAAPPPLATPSSASVLQEASGAEGDCTSPVPAPVTTVTEPDQHAEEAAAHIAIPAQRTVDQDSSPSSALSVDAVRRAVREVLTEELAPVLTTLTAPDSIVDGPASDQQDVPDRLHEAAGEIKEELGTALEEARSQLASLPVPAVITGRHDDAPSSAPSRASSRCSRRAPASL
ncbi:hypothetical protein ACPEIC_45720 [Stenotrophomonas sp. NPDC087984]